MEFSFRDKIDDVYYNFLIKIDKQESELTCNYSQEAVVNKHVYQPELAEKELKLTKFSDPLKEGKRFFSLAENQRESDRLDQSIKNYKSALIIFKNCGEAIGEAYSLLGLARCNTLLNNPRDAGYMYEEALKLLQSLNDEEGVAYCFKGIGQVSYGTAPQC